MLSYTMLKEIKENSTRNILHFNFFGLFLNTHVQLQHK